MTLNAFAQFTAFVIATLAVVLPLDAWLGRLFDDTRSNGGAITRFLSGSGRPQTWLMYLRSIVVFNVLGGIILFLLLIFQNHFPHNPQNFPGVPPVLAFNIAVSFMTNTNWQSYGGETTLSYFSQMMGLTVQNFFSAATGIAIAFALSRAFIRREDQHLGNFYTDVTRGCFGVLLPLAIIMAIFLLAQGVPENLASYTQAQTMEGVPQTIAQGPVASQIAIKMLGSNGGGFFNANAAHPYENPTPLTNFIQMISIAALPIAVILAFGRIVGDRRQGWALLITMAILFLGFFAVCVHYEMHGVPTLQALGVDQSTNATNPGGNMEGKEVRFGVMNSSLWAVLTTSTTNGSVNSMHDSFTPLGGMVLLFNMLLGGVIFGGVGCGLYGMMMYVLIAVFISGLMVGRTPEYLGKKIESYEVKLAVLAQLLYPACILGGGMLSLLIPAGASSISTPGPHGLTQTLYAYASATANNGSAFAGFNANTNFQNILLGIIMLIGRFGIIIPVMAIAGSLASKKIIPVSNGTLPTHGAMFIVMLLGVILMMGGLTYFPVLALGPLAEHLQAFGAGVIQ